MSSKVLLTNNNSPWGIITRPISDNVYKHIINFPDINKRDEFINNYLFNGEDYKSLFNNSPNRSIVMSNSVMGSFKVDISEYPNDTIQTLLNKDTAILQETTNKGIEYLFYAITGANINRTIIEYTLELDVFFTYWHKININTSTYINKAHMKRTINSIWDSNINNPNYNQIKEKTKFIENKSIPTIRKPVDNIEVAFNEEYNKIITDKSGKLYTAYLFTLKETGEGIISLNTQIKNGSTILDTNYNISIWPINYEISATRIDQTGSILYNSEALSNVLSSATDRVLGCIISEYLPIDFSNTTLVNNSEIFWNGTNLTMKSATDGYSYANLYTTNNPFGGSTALLTIKLIDFDIQSQYNKYTIDLSEYSYSNLIGNEREIGGWQNNLRNIEVNIIGNDNSYILPHYLLGTQLEFIHLINLDNTDFGEIYELQNSFNQKLYEGLYKENSSYLQFVDNYSEDYKYKNKNIITSKKIGIGLDVVAGVIGLAAKQPFMSMLFAREGITQVSSLADINRMSGIVKGDGYTTLRDIFNFKYSIGLYCQENIAYGNLYQQNIAQIVKNGVEVNDFYNFNEIYQSRKYFNFIQCEDIFNKITTINLSPQIKQLISASFENGITLWHYRDGETWPGVANYNVDNEDYNE